MNDDSDIAYAGGTAAVRTILYTYVFGASAECCDPS